MSAGTIFQDPPLTLKKPNPCGTLDPGGRKSKGILLTEFLAKKNVLLHFLKEVFVGNSHFEPCSPRPDWKIRADRKLLLSEFAWLRCHLVLGDRWDGQ